MTYKHPGLDVPDTMLRLCKRHGAQTVLNYVRDWVAYMETVEKLANTDTVGRSLGRTAHIDGSLRSNEGGGSVEA